MLLQYAGLCFTDATGAPFSHQPWLVATSYVIAAIGSFAALDMAERLRAAKGPSAYLWLVGSAATLGGSIWAMHFVGLLALRMALPIDYDPRATVLSLLIAISVVGVGLQIARSGVYSIGRLMFAGGIVGLGVAAMHYVGMSALLLPGRIGYHPGLWGLSVLIAVAAATVALWLSAILQATWQRALAALAMATAISGMHYTGMQSTVFLVDPSVSAPSSLVATPLAVAVGGITLVLLGLAIVSAAIDRRLYAAARHEADALRAANAELERTQKEIVRRLCRAGEFRDSDTGEHVDRIGLLAHRLALASGCPASFAEALQIAAPLHDIGKIGVADAILLKPGRLDPTERRQMQRHSEIGHDILTGSGVQILDVAAEIAKYHHEKWDGSGYPGDLAGEAIPLASRIVAIVDVFDALMSRRSYKEPWPLDAVAAHLRAQAGRHFDPRLVDAFLSDLPGMVAISIRLASPEHLAARLAAALPDGDGQAAAAPSATVIALRRA